MSMPVIVYVFPSERQYVSYFRENVAKSFVALVDPGLTYSPEPPKHLRSQILAKYHIAQFDGRTLLGGTRQMVPIEGIGGGIGGSPSPGLSNFITGVIEKRPFQLCCVALHGSERMFFVGMFVSMKVSRNLRGFIKVQRKTSGNRAGTGTQFIPEAGQRKMDSVTFEKDFSVGSNDQITAMQYLTADVMELLLNFKNELIDVQSKFNSYLSYKDPDSIRLDFFWQGDEVLMRIGNRKMFIPTSDDPMCQGSLACCLSSLRFVTKFNQTITKSIKETAI